MLAPVFSKCSPALQLFDLSTGDLCLVLRGALCLSLPPLPDPLMPWLCSRRNRDNESGGIITSLLCVLKINNPLKPWWNTQLLLLKSQMQWIENQFRDKQVPLRSEKLFQSQLRTPYKSHECSRARRSPVFPVIPQYFFSTHSQGTAHPHISEVPEVCLKPIWKKDNSRKWIPVSGLWERSQMCCTTCRQSALVVQSWRPDPEWNPDRKEDLYRTRREFPLASASRPL